MVPGGLNFNEEQGKSCIQEEGGSWGPMGSTRGCDGRIESPGDEWGDYHAAILPGWF